MYARPLDSDTTSVRLADWIEIELAAVGAASLSIDDLADDLHDDPSDASSDEEASGDDGKRHRARERAEEAFMEISRRAGWLGVRYPIRFEEDEVEVVRWEEQCDANLLYRFLALLRAKQMLGSVMNGGTPDPGFLFEEIVTQATNSYVGAGHAVRFGTAGGHRGNGLPDALSEAIGELARRMNEEPASAITGEGDYRADAVAWRPFGDKRAGQLVMLSQATITEGEWLVKQIPPKWKDRRLIRLLAPPLPAVAFVETLSSYPLDFWKGGQLSSVPFDRLRILSLVSDDDLDSEIAQGITDWTAWAMGTLPR